MPTVTKDEALLYIGVDYTDKVVDANATRALASAWQTVLGAVGEDVDTYLPNDPRVKELTLIYFEDLYSQRGLSAKVSGATRRLVQDMEWQLRLELIQARAKGAGA